jgi:GTPase SAR1 family protein
MVFDITSKNSFSELNDFYHLFQENASESCLLYLIGNKCDLSTEREVSIENILKYQTKTNATTYMEISAKTGQGVNDLFEHIISQQSRLFFEGELIEVRLKVKGEHCC